jgi:predicted phosphoadenosine phosphosulfate sulfurtransferase
MKELIIFGRSPFINQLDLTKIDYLKYDVCCINFPIPNIKVRYVVAADVWVKPVLAPQTEFISENTGWHFKKTPSEIIRKQKELSWCYYSSSLAVNFAILRGYKTIYLAGIDLIEDNKPFNHYDGIINTKAATIEAVKTEKTYIKKLAQNIDIYQLNPICDWLKYKDIGLLQGQKND